MLFFEKRGNIRYQYNYNNHINVQICVCARNVNNDNFTLDTLLYFFKGYFCGIHMDSMP